MKPSKHILVSALLSGLIYITLRSSTAAAGCFIAGVLIDIDHLPDYFINHGRQFRVRHFFKTFKNEILKHIIVFLHAWEWVPAGLVILWLSGWQPVVAGVLAGATLHLLLDQIFNHHRPAAYFITYRLFHKFSGRRFYGEQEYKKRVENLAKERE